MYFIVTGPSDIWPYRVSIFEIVGCTATIILEIFRELNKLNFNNVVTFYDNFERSYSQKRLWLFDLGYQMRQGHSESNQLIPGLCPTIP